MHYFKLYTLLIVTLSSTLCFGADKKKHARWPIPKEIQLNKASQTKLYDIIVIGGGSSGTMAARQAVLNNDNVLFVTGERKTENQARGMWVPKFNNTPTFTETKRPVVAIRNETLVDISHSPLKNKLHILEKSIEHIVKGSKNGQDYFKVTDSAGSTYRSKYVILATGIMDVQPHIQGTIRPILSFANRQQAIYCLRCDGHLTVNKNNVVIFGEKDSAASSAILVVERYNLPNVAIVTNGMKPNWSKEKDALIKRYKVKVHTQRIKALSDRKEKILKEIIFADDSKIKADLAIINLGIRANNKLAKELGAQLSPKGYVIGNEDGLTSVKGLYVAGDLKAGTRKQVYVAWDSAIRAAEAINKIIRMKKRVKKAPSKRIRR